jgi:hypothetical protein
MTPLTVSILTYNEAARIVPAVTCARQWADDVLVLDKSSTDNTRELADGLGARVVTIPFTRQGHEDTVGNTDFAANDWVFVMTPGEIPTRELVAKVREALAAHGEQVDIITIPKKLYSFGIHHPSSPWSVGQQPMLFHRRRAVLTNHVHRNFTVRDPRRMFHIPYSETCHVYHPTHATAESFLRSHFDYIMAESQGSRSPQELLTEALRQISAYDFNGHDPVLFGQEAAWKLYWLGCCLAAWEKKRGVNVPEVYRTETLRRLEEWQGKG